VGESAIWSLHGLDDPRVAVADGGHGDAGAEVDELVAVGIDEDPARPATT
jgi:hypothetical protein